MTGLDKIIQAIESEAKATAKMILDAANKEAEDILTAAKAQAANKVAEIAAKSEMDVKSVLSRAESGARLQEKKLILNAKLQVIGDILAKAKEKLRNMPDSEYFNIILQIIKKHAHKKSGKVVFSAKDLKRMPKDYNNSIQNALISIPGAALTVAEETADINGGCLLIYGDVEENCSFDALFSSMKEELQDKVNAFLYE